MSDFLIYFLVQFADPFVFGLSAFFGATTARKNLLLVLAVIYVNVIHIFLWDPFAYPMGNIVSTTQIERVTAATLATIISVLFYYGFYAWKNRKRATT